MSQTADLRKARCHNHSFREAVVRCPACKGDFCRECVTEHRGKMLCTNCLKQADQRPQRAGTLLKRIALLLFFVMSFMVTWAFFFWIAEVLAGIPQKYHDGTFLTESIFRED